MKRTKTVDTTELDKMLAVKDDAEVIQHFLDWLCDERAPRGISIGGFMSERERERLMAQYFGIDLDKMERERMALLTDIRQDHKVNDAIKARTA